MTGTHRAERTQEIPIRTCETVRASGRRVRTLRVFCPQRAQTVGVETCAHCPKLRSLPEPAEAAGARIVCAPAARGTHPPPLRHRGSPESFTVLAAGVAVGEAMPSHVVCVRPEVPLAEAFAAEPGPFLPVVDADGALVGVLYRPDLVPSRLRDAFEDRLRAASPTTVIVAERMHRRPRTLHESAPLAEALHAMTADRARSLPIVGDGGTVVGTLTDLDLLRWYGRARRAASLRRTELTAR